MEASKLETNEGRPLQVYEPNRQIHLGWRVWPEMFDELYRARELLWRLAWRDVRARTKQSAFGIVVSVVSPLMLMGVFAYLNRHGAVQVGATSVSYPLFLYAGLLPWQMLAGGLTRATPSLVDAASLVGKIQFPRETLVLSGVAQAVFDYLLSLPVLVLLLVLFRQGLEPTVVFVPMVVLIQLAFLSGLSFLLALAHAALRDVGNALPMLLVVWMFVTPIIYADAAEQTTPIASTPARLAGATSKIEEGPLTQRDAARSASWVQRSLRVVNPMHALVVSYRDLMFRGRLTMPGALAWSAMASVAIWLFGWRVFHLVEPKIAERV